MNFIEIIENCIQESFIDAELMDEPAPSDKVLNTARLLTAIITKGKNPTGGGLCFTSVGGVELTFRYEDGLRLTFLIDPEGVTKCIALDSNLVVLSSGNVFRDLGFENPEAELAKAEEKAHKNDAAATESD